MPVYFFHTQDGRLVLDDVGTTLVDLAAAKIEAVRLLGAMIVDDPEEFLTESSVKLLVTNAAGGLLFALEVSAVDTPVIPPRLVRDFL